MERLERQELGGWVEALKQDLAARFDEAVTMWPDYEAFAQFGYEFDVVSSTPKRWV